MGYDFNMSEENFGCLKCDEEIGIDWKPFVRMELGNNETTYETMDFCSLSCVKKYFGDKDAIMVKLVKGITENRKLAISEAIADNPNYAKEIMEVMI